MINNASNGIKRVMYIMKTIVKNNNNNNNGNGSNANLSPADISIMPLKLTTNLGDESSQR